MLTYQSKASVNDLRYWSNLFITAISFLTIASTSALACPEPNSDRIDYRNLEETRILETSDGGQYACWWDQNAAPITFENTTYRVIIRCSPTLIVYTNLDSIDTIVFENNGSRTAYTAEYLGDRYECDAQGQTVIKSWVYRQGNEVIRQDDYRFYPYKW